MNCKNSVQMGTLGGYLDQFHQFTPARRFKHRMEVAKFLPRTHWIGTLCAQDVGHGGVAVNALQNSGLTASAVNGNIKIDRNMLPASVHLWPTVETLH